MSARTLALTKYENVAFGIAGGLPLPAGDVACVQRDRMDVPESDGVQHIVFAVVDDSADPAALLADLLGKLGPVEAGALIAAALNEPGMPARLGEYVRALYGDGAA